MNKSLLVSWLFLLLIPGSTLLFQNLTNARAASLFEQKTLVLYDAASGAVPNESLMDFTDFPPGAASLTYSDGAAVMDSTISDMGTFAGWVSGQAITPEFPLLDRTAGFQVNFTLQVERESHAENDRAGFSVIILDQEAKGIELAFWEDEIWAQNDDHTGELFTHGEGVAFAAAAGLTEYQVTIIGDSYTLTVNSTPLLSGPVRDYSNFDGFPDPYETPNFLFWGDDTTDAYAHARLSFVSITATEPELPAIASTSNPQPTSSFPSLPSATPLPSPIPSPNGNNFELCPSGWLLLIMTVGSAMVSRRIRRQ